MPRQPDLKPLGDTLREFREAAGISQEKLADKVGIDRTVIGATERAERNVGYRQIRRVLVTLGVSWTEFGRELDKRDARPDGKKESARRVAERSRTGSR